MGQRANYVIMEGSTYRLFYSHWGARTLPQDLFWGPEYALRFIVHQEERGVEEWLDDIWCEGAALLDQNKKILLLFGGEHFLGDAPLTKMYLKLIRNIWQGWQIFWAYQGLVDIAKYVGKNVTDVLSKEDRIINPSFTVALSEEFYEYASILWPKIGMIIYPLDNTIEEYLLLGASIIDKFQKVRGYPKIQPPEIWDEEYPSGGLHIDITDQSLTFWQGFCVYRLDQILQKWTGWSVNWLKDDYQYYQETIGDIILPEPSTEKLITWLWKILSEDPFSKKDQEGNKVIILSQLLAEEGHKVDINPDIFLHQKSDITYREKLKIFQNALQSIKSDILPEK